MEYLISRYRNLTVLLIVIVGQLLLLAYQVKSSQDVRLIRVWSVTAVTPLAKVLEAVRRNTIGVVEDYFVLINVRDQNRRLLEENGRLKMDNQFLKAELETADRARALSAFQSRTPSKTIPARIIGTGTGTNARVVFVDQGSRQGIMRGMAVVTPDGIVGKVLASYPTASQVLLITDQTFGAGVVSDKNRVHGTLKGLGQSKCIVQYVQNEEKVEVGEAFYTSGDDRVFPKGLPVGKVTVVRDGKEFKEIFVVPSGFQQGLEEVLIVLEGVHQPLPDAKDAPAPGYYIQPLPPDVSKAPAAGTPPGESKTAILQTDADRIRDRYKALGAAQKHTFGEGLPGSKPPDFNLELRTARPGQPGRVPSEGAPSGAPAATVPERPVASGGTPSGGTAAAAKSKPVSSASTPTPTGTPQQRSPMSAPAAITNNGSAPSGPTRSEAHQPRVSPAVPGRSGTPPPASTAGAATSVAVPRTAAPVSSPNPQAPALNRRPATPTPPAAEPGSLAPGATRPRPAESDVRQTPTPR